jgi:ribosomal protein S27AE
VSLGKRFDAWLTTQPEEPDILVPGDEGYPRCSQCGAFLKREPDRTEPGELHEHCDGGLHPDVTTCGDTRGHAPHEFTAHAWEELHRTCARCGHGNITTDA